MKTLRAAARYALVSSNWVAQYPKELRPLSWMRDFNSWRVERDSTSSPLDRAEPWFCYSAIRHLKKVVKPETRVFEYGSGGSTLFYAKHCAKVVTAEHDAEWGQLVQKTLDEQKISNVTLLSVTEQKAETPEEADQLEGYGSEYQHYAGSSFKNYVNTLLDYPKHEFDLIIVDGRSRCAGMRTAVERIAPGGMIIVDNAERPRYQEMEDRIFAGRWHLHRSCGPVCGLKEFNSTHFWTHPDAK